MTIANTVPAEQAPTTYSVPSVVGEECISCGRAQVKAAYVAVMENKPSVHVFFCRSHAVTEGPGLAAKGWKMYPEQPQPYFRNL